MEKSAMMDEDMFHSLLEKINSERYTPSHAWDGAAAVRRRLANDESKRRGYENWLDAYKTLIESHP